MRCLIVSIADWHGPARLPKALKRLDWEVGLLCRRYDAAAKTRFVDRLFLVNPRTEMGVMTDILNAIEVWQPDLIIPSMEPVVKALYDIWNLHAAGRLPDVSESTIAAIRRSIADPAKFSYFQSKIDLLNALEARGVRIPPMRELHHLGDAADFVEKHGYPVVVKPDVGAGGVGIAICETEEELLTALRERLRPGQTGRWCVQKYIRGKTANHHLAALDGRKLAGVSMLRMVVHPEPTGPSTVIKIIEDAEMDAAGERFADLVGYNGLGSTQFVVDETTNEPYLIEANFRIGAFKHLGYLMGHDMCLALTQGLEGKPIEPGTLNEGLTVTLYPQEPLRDPDSEHLKGVVDWVEDDPDLAQHYRDAIAAKVERLKGIVGALSMLFLPFMDAMTA